MCVVGVYACGERKNRGPILIYGVYVIIKRVYLHLLRSCVPVQYVKTDTLRDLSEPVSYGLLDDYACKRALGLSNAELHLL